MVKGFRKVEQRQLIPIQLPNTNDEFLYLFQRFNMMVDNLKELIHKVYEQQLRAQSSELKQLQAQINPHFLYNTYFILYRLAKMNDNESIARFSQYLGDYFQYITRNASDEIPLEMEFKHSLTYAEIQNIRFQNRIQVEFEQLEEQFKSYRFPRLILHNFFALFDSIMSSVEDQQALQTGLSLEVFFELCAIFIANMNRLGVFSEISKSMNMSRLLSIREHETWQDVTVYYRTLAERLFQAMSNENEQATHEVISTLQDYIDHNLHGDLSLNRLADLVYLTPFYVSRLYKQITKRSLSDYIAEKKIDKAKLLLSRRFFRKLTTLAPQEYRESLKRI